LKIKNCDKKVFEKGTSVFDGHPSIPTEEMEKWVKRVAELSKQKVDWYPAGGNRIVRALGDIDRVKQAIAFLKPEYDELEERARRL